MLQGTAQTWLNNLKPRSINSWVDFTEVFVRNFTSTYKRPPKPRQLSLCVQGPNESTRDYLTRWAELRNSCEGVHEVQAIEYFTAGCREGTLLKHQLLCDEPATLDELLIIADKYATADSSMKSELRVDTSGKVLPPAPRTPAGDNSRRQQPNDNKRKAQQPACAAASSRLAESLMIVAEKKLLDRVVAMAGKQPDLSPEPKESETEGSFKPAKETKKIPLDPEHPERHAVIGYHQIKLNPADRVKTSFITPFRAFCYLTMTFGLRNAGATFQRCMQKCLLKQLRRNAHVYVDDIVVKTEKRGTLLEDLKETFENLCRFQIKLNPEKCVFGVPDGQLLGFLVSERGIECNPMKIKAIERMELKKMLTTPPVLAALAAKEPMYLYIAATSRVVSTVMVVERPEDGGAQPVQRPVYYLSEVLPTSKQNYPHYQKMCYGVHFAAKKLKPYFQEHPITVVCTAPLAEIIGNRDALGRVAKWAIELAPYTIFYQPRTAIKSQALANFLVDWAKTQYLPPAPDSTHWRMHFDGSKMRTGLGADIVLTSPKGDKLRYMLEIHFAASNNVPEYEALIHGLRLAKEINIRRILCYGDSDLVVQQSSGDWDAKDANMASYRFLVQQLSGYFEGCEFLHSNGQVEWANGRILSGIKPRLVEPLERSAGYWIDELPTVLWSLRTTPNKSTGFTPFFLVYGAEAVIPTDIEFDSPRVTMYTEAEAKEAREDDVDLLEEGRLLALSRSAIYQQSLHRYHSRKVKPRSFQEGDLVLRLIQRTAGQHKLSAPWEGPFIISKALGNDSYYLIDAQKP
ncbi:unnamed protein product [Triticum aestivum]|uniref:Uncharacterized protein n=1 Tax=Triticum aestivum TaxID=4565 RepID=A0A7H4LEN2_WHEAT|nr:unnamed protein product [Triticum aestivum]